MAAYKCPVCGTPLSRERWEQALGIWQSRQEHLQHREAQVSQAARELKRERREILNRGVETGKRMEKRRADSLARQLAGLLERDRNKDKRIRELEQQLKRGTTPQVEGLLYEDQLAKQLRNAFPQDEVRHTGKGGDVILRIRANGRVDGTVVFECKKVQKILKSHVEQTHRAILQRQADFGILVTSGTSARFRGFGAEGDVLIVNPAGVLFLTRLLRGLLVEMAKLKLARAEREKAAREIFKYLESAEFKTQMRDVIERAWKLGELLREEVETHWRSWKRRHGHYKAIFEESSAIGQSFSRIMESQLAAGTGSKLLLPARSFPEVSPIQAAD